jgi:hypothetical protein
MAVGLLQRFYQDCAGAMPLGLAGRLRYHPSPISGSTLRIAGKFFQTRFAAHSD